MTNQTGAEDIDVISEHFQNAQESILNTLGVDNSQVVNQITDDGSQHKIKKSQSHRYKEKYLEERARAEEKELELLELKNQNIELKRGRVESELTNTYDSLVNAIEKEKSYLEYKKKLINDKIEARYNGDMELEKELENKHEELNDLLNNIKSEKQELTNSYNILYHKYYDPNLGDNTSNSYRKNDFSSDFEDLMKKYPIFDHRNNNKDYSPTALARLNEISSRLTQEFKKNGRSNEVWTTDYYDELEKEIQKEFKSNSKNNFQSPRVVSTPTLRESVAIDSPIDEMTDETKEVYEEYAKYLSGEDLVELRRNLLNAQRNM